MLQTSGFDINFNAILNEDATSQSDPASIQALTSAANVPYFDLMITSEIFRDFARGYTYNDSNGIHKFQLQQNDNSIFAQGLRARNLSQKELHEIVNEMANHLRRRL